MCGGGGTHMVAPEAYKPYVGGNSNRCGTWCQSLRLQGLALGPGENPARTRGRADKPCGTGSPKRINPINWGSDPTIYIYIHLSKTYYILT